MRLMCICLWVLSLTSAAFAEERKSLSIDDILTGFEKKELFYFETLFEHGKYLRTFNKCLNSKSADFSWIKQYCKKNPEFKNAFQCAEDSKTTHIRFIYESQEKCEEVRRPMKDRMDAMRQ